MFINNNCHNQIDELTVFADNCPGQNKNRFIIEMLSSSLINHPNIQVIQLAFFEKGHTQNENDTAHSVREKSKNGINMTYLICGVIFPVPLIQYQLVHLP